MAEYEFAKFVIFVQLEFSSSTRAPSLVVKHSSDKRGISSSNLLGPKVFLLEYGQVGKAVLFESIIEGSNPSIPIVRVAEWSIAMDCKSILIRVHRFKSCP